VSVPTFTVHGTRPRPGAGGPSLPTSGGLSFVRTAIGDQSINHRISVYLLRL
jgi:hypothetical protein